MQGALLIIGCLVKQIAQGGQDGRALQLQMINHLHSKSRLSNAGQWQSCRPGVSLKANPLSIPAGPKQDASCPHSCPSSQLQLQQHGRDDVGLGW